MFHIHHHYLRNDISMFSTVHHITCGLWCQKQVSQAGISNCIPQYSVCIPQYSYYKGGQFLWSTAPDTCGQSYCSNYPMPCSMAQAQKHYRQTPILTHNQVLCGIYWDWVQTTLLHCSCIRSTSLQVPCPTCHFQTSCIHFTKYRWPVSHSMMVSCSVV